MTTPDEVLLVAVQELGVVESPANSNKTKYGKWYGADANPWCAMFVSWVFDRAGLRLPASTAKGFAYTPSGAAWFQKQNRWRGRGGVPGRPQRGDVVFFDFPGDNVNRISHVAIVEKANADGSIQTIEGNTSPGDGGSQRDGGGVYRRVRKTGIVGYGVPDFSKPVPVPQPPEEEEEVKPYLFSNDIGEVFIVTGNKVVRVLPPFVEAYKKRFGDPLPGNVEQLDHYMIQFGQK